MSQTSPIKLNIAQNQSDFQVKPLNEQPPLFKLGYLKRYLDPIKENPEEIRTCTIKCNIRNCK
jgi:hypothetical protein